MGQLQADVRAWRRLARSEFARAYALPNLAPMPRMASGERHKLDADWQAKIAKRLRGRATAAVGAVVGDPNAPPAAADTPRK